MWAGLISLVVGVAILAFALILSPGEAHHAGPQWYDLELGQQMAVASVSYPDPVVMERLRLLGLLGIVLIGVGVLTLGLGPARWQRRQVAKRGDEHV